MRPGVERQVWQLKPDSNPGSVFPAHCIMFSG